MSNEENTTEEVKTLDENTELIDKLYPDDKEQKAEDPSSEGESDDNQSTEEKTTDDNNQASSEDPDSEKDEVAEKKEGDDEKSDEDESKDDGDSEEKAEVKLSLSEGSLASQHDIDQVMDLVEKYNIDQGVADEILRQREEAVASAVERGQAEEDKQIADWEKQVVDDPIMGGDNLKRTAESAKRVLDKFGSEELIGVLNDTGYGSHPEVFKFLAQIGELMNEDTLVTGNLFTPKPKTTEEVFYGTN